MELIPTITTKRTKHIPSKTLGVNTNQHLIFGLYLAHNQGYMLLPVELVHISKETKFTILGGKTGGGDPPHKLLRPHPIFDQVGYGDHLDPVLPTKLYKLRRPSHRPIITHYLADDTRRIKSCQPCQINRRLSLPRPLQHPSFLSH